MTTTARACIAAALWSIAALVACADDDDAAPGPSGAVDGGSDAPASDGGPTTGDAGADADASCGDLQSDPASCGACGYACLHGRTCAAGRCTPAWQPLATAGAPAGRDRHAAAGLGTKYVASGGRLAGSTAAIAAAVAYDLATDTWSTFPSHVSARLSHEMVTAGAKLYVFGGITDASSGSTIGPGLEESAGGAWAVTSAPGTAPKGRYNFAMTWTGTELLLYGGSDDVGPAVATGARLGAGGWGEASCSLAGCQRGGYFTLFRDGNVARLFGGGPFGDAPAGLAFDLVAGQWGAWTVPAGGPDLSSIMRRADDGRRIWFVKEGASCDAAPSLEAYDRVSQAWSKDTSTPPPGVLGRGAAAWVGGELVVWSGDCGSGPTQVGGRFQPAAP